MANFRSMLDFTIASWLKALAILSTYLGHPVPKPSVGPAIFMQALF